MPHHPLRLSLAGLMASALLTLPFSGLSFAATYSATAPTVGTGSISDPYQISTPDQLVWMDQHASGSRDAYELTANIDLTGYAGWVPITGFAGTFNGQGYTISNLTTDTPVLSTTTHDEELGMFGDITTSATVENVTFSQWTMTSTNSSVYAAGIVGYNYGQVTHVSVLSSTLSTASDTLGGLIGNSATTTAVTANTVQQTTVADSADADAVGGLVGMSGYVSTTPGNITDNTVAQLTLSASNLNTYAVGGVVGYAETGVSANQLIDSTINAASDQGNAIVGGIVGLFEPPGSQSVSTNVVTDLSLTGGSTLGGIIGYNNSESNLVNRNTVTDSHLTTDTSSNDVVSGLLIGQEEDGTVSNNSATGTMTFQPQSSANVYAGGLIGFNLATVTTNQSDVAITVNAYAAGDYIGGAIGDNQGPLSNVVTVGPIVLLGPINDSTIGNLVGYNGNSITNALVENTVQTPAPTNINEITLGGVVGYQTPEQSLTNILAVTHDGLNTLNAMHTPYSSVGAIAGYLQAPMTKVSQVYWDTTTEPSVSAVPTGLPQASMTGLSTTALASGQATLGSAWMSTTQAGIAGVTLPMLSGLQPFGTPPQITETATTPFVANSTHTQLTATVSAINGAPLGGLPMLFSQQTSVGSTDILAWTPSNGAATVVAPTLPRLPAQGQEYASLFGTVIAGPLVTPQAMPTTLTLAATSGQAPHTLQVTATLGVASPLVGSPSGTFTANIDGQPIRPTPSWQTSTSTASTLVETTTVAVYGGPHTLSVTYTDPSGLTATATASMAISTAPSRLSGLSVSQVTATSATLQWPAIAGTTGYTVQVDQNPILTVYQPSATIALRPATQSTVTVQAVYGTTASMPLTTTITTPPPPVSTLTVTAGSAGSGTATATWSAVYGATSYRLTLDNGTPTTVITGPTVLQDLAQNATLTTTIAAVYNQMVSTPLSVATWIPGTPTAPPPSSLPSSPPTVPSPSITQVSPEAVFVGAPITLTGTAFGNPGTVTLVQGNHPVSVTPIAWTATQIVCTVPSSLSPGLVQIRLTPGGSQASATATFTVLASPGSRVPIPVRPPIAHPVPPLSSLPASTATRLVLAAHTVGSLDVLLPNRSVVLLAVSHAVSQAVSIQVRYFPGVPKALPNRAGLAVFQLSVTNPRRLAQRITWLPTSDIVRVEWSQALPVGTTLQRWDVQRHQWVIMARAHTITHWLKAPLPHMAHMTYLLVPPLHH